MNQTIFVNPNTPVIRAGLSIQVSISEFGYLNA
jgi:hypothetical protein